MRRYDPNPGLSAFAVVLGAVLGLAAAALLGLGGFGFVVCLVLGLAAAALLGLGGFGFVVCLVLGVALAGIVASSLGIVGERDRGDRASDLPSHYDDY